MPSKKIDKQNLTALILSGGSGKRLASKDKGLIELGKKPLVSHMIEALYLNVSAIVINCNRNIDCYEQIADYYSNQLSDHNITIRCITDINPDNNKPADSEQPVFRGPLVGIYQLLLACPTQYALIFPVDCPFFPKYLVNQLLQALSEANVDACYPEINQQSQHLLLAVNTEKAIRAFKQIPNQGANLPVKRWLDQLRLSTVSIHTPPEAFININSDIDLQTAKNQIEKH